MMLFLTLLLALVCPALAKRQLFSTSLVTCMENTKIVPHYFKVTFDPDKRSLKYDISITTEVSGYIYAYVDVYAYGIDVIQEELNFCSIGWKQFCPMFTGSMEVESVEYIDKKYVDMIPGIAFTFPDLDAVARIIIVNSKNEPVGCLQSSFSNGRTVSHIGAKWATAVVAGIGLLISSVLSLFGNSASASRMSAMSLTMFTYFQSVIIISMLHVQKIPPIAGAWSENLAWSMGLIETSFMQKIFRWYVQATGGTPTQYLTSTTLSLLAQRSLDFGVDVMNNGLWSAVSTLVTGGSSLARRATQPDSSNFINMDDVEGSKFLKILRGMIRVGYKAGIEPTSIVCTGFTFFIIFLYVLVAGFLVFRLACRGRRGRRDGAESIDAPIDQKRPSLFRRSVAPDYAWNTTLKGTLLRYIYIGFPQLVILSLWEFTQVDSPAVVVIAVFFLLLALSTMGYSCYKVIKFGRQSVAEHNNAAAILYGESRILGKYGFLYTMLDAQKYWFAGVMLLYWLVKFIFVSLCQGSGKTQALVIFVLDLAYTIYTGIQKPYLDKPTNVMNICISSVNTVNSLFFTFFSGLFHTPSAVAAIMGLVFFFLNAAFSLLLLIYILFFACVVVFSKNPDAKFSPAKDDRASFRKKHQSLYNGPDGAEELLDLGQVAQGHNANWASEMYKLKNLVDSSNSASEVKDEGSELVADEADKPKRSGSRLGLKIKDTLHRGKSLLSRKGTTRKNKKQEADDLPLTSNSPTSKGSGHDTIGDLQPPDRFVKSDSGHVSIPSSSSNYGLHQRLTSVDGSVDTSLYTNEATQPANLYKTNGSYGHY